MNEFNRDDALELIDDITDELGEIGFMSAHVVRAHGLLMKLRQMVNYNDGNNDEEYEEWLEEQDTKMRELDFSDANYLNLDNDNWTDADE